jgi:hypothetical protein
MIVGETVVGEMIVGQMIFSEMRETHKKGMEQIKMKPKHLKSAENRNAMAQSRCFL